MIYNASQTEVLHNSIKLEDIPIFKPLHSTFIWRPDTHSFTNEHKVWTNSDGEEVSQKNINIHSDFRKQKSGLMLVETASIYRIVRMLKT